MATLKKMRIKSIKRDPNQVLITKPVTASQTDGPVSAISSSTGRVNSVNQKRYFMEMPPDKEMEVKVLQARFVYLSNNLPPDDISMEMNSRGLLTVKEHEEYMSMKRSHLSDSTKSEYLLLCLGRRKAGFLTHFCEILREIEQASYLADDIIEAYKRAALQKGCTPTACNRTSKISLSISDPDLRSTKDTCYAQECTRCKILEHQIKKLERQRRHLKDQQLLNQTTLLPFKPLAEVAQEQLQRGLAEINKLMTLLPPMQEAITQATGGISGAQASLKKMNDVLGQDMAMQKKALWALPQVASLRESVLSEVSVFASEGEFDRSSYREPVKEHDMGH